MYDELIRSCRACATGYEGNCDNCMFSGEDCYKQLHKASAEAIEDLTRENESLTRENESLAKIVNEASEILRRRWIPVTEKLPEPNAVDKYGFAKGYLVKTDRHVMMHTARYTGKWWIIWGTAEVITDTVTHWMTLPDLPEEKT